MGIAPHFEKAFGLRMGVRDSVIFFHISRITFMHQASPEL
jgi:hypothetical protein